MDTPQSPENETLSRMARQHFLQTLCASIPELDKFVVRQFESQGDSGFRELKEGALPLGLWFQEYMLRRRTWAQTLLEIWRAAFVDPSSTKRRKSLESASSIEELQLISDDAIDGLIASSRISMQVAERVDPGFTEMRRRLMRVGVERLPPDDPVQPAVIAENLVEAWRRAGLDKRAFGWVMEGISKEWAAILMKAYKAANTFLEERGIEAVQPVQAPPQSAQGADPRRAGGPAGMVGGGYSGAGQSGPGGYPPGVYQPGPHAPAGYPPGALPQGVMPQGGYPVGVGYQPAAHQPGPHPGGTPGDAVGASPGFLAPQMVVPGVPVPMGPPLTAPRAQFGQQAIQQVHALWSDIRARMAHVVGGSAGAVVEPANVHTGLVHVMAVQQAQVGQRLEQVAAQTAFVQSPELAGQQVALLARQQSEAIKEEAEQSNEKAIIEMVALMFQSVLSEDRVPASLRVLFARLQVPVLRVALADPAFFSDMEHPVRRLIDRMGSAAMGFDGANFQGSALEQELRRIVQMIEQYPDTGAKVFQLALNEFEKFLQKYLSEHRLAGKAMSVAQQMEEKETLLVRFTIELRKMLQDLPIKEEVRTFLFKTWAEVLAVSAVRAGPKGEETLKFKQTASLLVWATSAKTSKRERRRLMQALPKLDQRLRHGLSLVGVVDMVQDAALAKVASLVHDAFLARSEAVPAEKLKKVSARLDNLENFVGDEAVDDVPLSRESVELLLGVELSGLVVVEPDGQEAAVSDEVLEWARNRSAGEWYHMLGPAEQAHAGVAGAGLRVQYAWHSKQRHLHLLLGDDGRSYLLKLRTLASHFEQGRLVPFDQEGLMLRATRVALTQYQPLAAVAGSSGHVAVPPGRDAAPIAAEPDPKASLSPGANAAAELRADAPSPAAGLPKLVGDQEFDATMVVPMPPVGGEAGP